MMTRPEPWDMAIDELTRRIEALEDQVLPHPATMEQEPCSHVWEDSIDVRTCRRCYITEEMPEPKWRRLVGEQQWRIPPDHPPLATVLHCLARIERGQAGDSHVLPTPAYLARVVAVCEAQVGDGWQADPPCTVLDGMNDCPEAHSDGRCCIYCLIDSFTAADEWKWKHLGNRAACWLRDITEATP